MDIASKVLDGLTRFAHLCVAFPGSIGVWRYIWYGCERYELLIPEEA
jgi:hypothetical protein